LGPPVEYFLKAYTFKSVLSVHALMVLKCFACLVPEKKDIKLLLAPVKTLTVSKNCSESRIKLLFRLPFALSDRFSPVYIYVRFSGQFVRVTGRRLSEKILETQAATRNQEQAPRQLLEGLSQLVSDFIEAGRNLI
jgi:hypothetical protein